MKTWKLAVRTGLLRIMTAPLAVRCMAEGEKVKFKFFDAASKKETIVESLVGMTVLEAAHKHDVQLEGACEGNCACGTCHVVLDEATFKKLSAAKEEEEDVLQVAFDRKGTSRLACQVKVTKELEGATVTMPAQTRNINVKKF